MHKTLNQSRENKDGIRNPPKRFHESEDSRLRMQKYVKLLSQQDNRHVIPKPKASPGLHLMFHDSSFAVSKYMAPSNYQHFLILLLLNSICIVDSYNITKPTSRSPFSCSDNIQKCDSYLYHNFIGLHKRQIKSFYSVNTSEIKPISHGNKEDYLVSVPCTCKDVNGARGYFYSTYYRVQSGDTFASVNDIIYSGQAWKAAGDDEHLTTGHWITINLLCGCIEAKSEEVVTYTVQEDDTLAEIAELLYAKESGIENLNRNLTQNPNFIDVGWVLFVPMEKRGIQATKQGLQFFL